MKIFGAIWRLLDRRQRRELVLLQLLALLMALSTVGGIAAILPFFTVLAEPAAIQHSKVLNFLYHQLHFESGRSFVVVLGLTFVAVALVSNAINLLGSLAMSRFAYRVGDELRIALLDEYLHRNYAFHLKTGSSTLTSNVLFEIGRVTGGILQSGLSLIANLVTIVLILVSLVVLNPLIAAGAVVGLGGSYALTYTIARGRLLRNGLLESRNLAQRAKVVNEGFAAVKEVILRQAQALLIERFAGFSRSISKTTVNTMAVAQIPRHVLECITIVCLVGIALYLSGRGEAAGTWMAQLSFTGLAAYRLLPALQQAFAALVRIRADRAAFENIAADLRQAKANGRGGRPVAEDHSWRGKPRQDIRFEGVSYRHAPERAPAICDVTLRISAATTVGLVGANGSGKTTLVDVLAGLLVPDCGQVLIDGIALDETNRRAWQTAIAYVPQDIVLFDATLTENITLGVATERIDQERLRMAVRLARLEECVADLPQGYNEILGERGARLSGGQRQRIGIARALYRDASLLIMDEATNELDSLIEQELLGMLDSLRGRCTIILIAHRIGTVRHCDRIFEFENGRVSVCGSYEQLLRRSERLRRMADLSA